MAKIEDRRGMGREAKILRARKKVEGELSAENAERLEFLEETLVRPPPEDEELFADYDPEATPIPQEAPIPASPPDDQTPAVLVEVEESLPNMSDDDELPDLSEDDELPDLSADDEIPDMSEGEAQLDAPLVFDAEPDQEPIQSTSPRRELSVDDLFTESVKVSVGSTGSNPLELSTRDRLGNEEVQPNDLSGSRQVIVHMKGGLPRKGEMVAVDPAAELVELTTRREGEEEIRTFQLSSVVSITVLLPKGLAQPEVTGPTVRVTFKDGKTIEGISPDHDDKGPTLTVFNKDDKYIERVLAFRRQTKKIKVVD
jgi:hypothetical protein